MHRLVLDLHSQGTGLYATSYKLILGMHSRKGTCENNDGPERENGMHAGLVIVGGARSSWVIACSTRNASHLSSGFPANFTRRAYSRKTKVRAYCRSSTSSQTRHEPSKGCSSCFLFLFVLCVRLFFCVLSPSQPAPRGPLGSFSQCPPRHPPLPLS